MALFLSNTLLEALTNAPFMLLSNLVINCIPSTKSFSKSFLLICPLYLTSFPTICKMKFLFSNNFLSSIFSDANIKSNNFPFPLQIKWSLKPKNYFMKHFPRAAIPFNTLCIRICWLRHIHRGVLTIKLILVHFPSNPFLRKIAIGRVTSFSISTNRWNSIRKQMLQVYADVFKVIMLKASVAWSMKHNENQHYFSLWYSRIPMIIPFLRTGLRF